MPHSHDRRPGRSVRVADSSLAIGAALYRWRSAPEPTERLRPWPLSCCSVRRLTGPFAAVVAPVSTSHRVSLPTLDGYSSPFIARLRDVGGVCGGSHGASSVGRSRVVPRRRELVPQAAPPDPPLPFPPRRPAPTRYSS